MRLALPQSIVVDDFSVKALRLCRSTGKRALICGPHISSLAGIRLNAEAAQRERQIVAKLRRVSRCEGSRKVLISQAASGRSTTGLKRRSMNGR